MHVNLGFVVKLHGFILLMFNILQLHLQLHILSLYTYIH